MTAKDLHALPPEPPEPYEGGFTTTDAFGNDAVELHIGGDETGCTCTSTMTGRGWRRPRVDVHAPVRERGV